MDVHTLEDLKPRMGGLRGICSYQFFNERSNEYMATNGRQRDVTAHVEELDAVQVH